MPSISNINSSQNLPIENKKSTSSDLDSELQKRILVKGNINKNILRIPDQIHQVELSDEQLLEQFDQNKDNKLNAAEFMNWVDSSNPWQDVSTKILTDDLKTFDTNHDGFINPDESQNMHFLSEKKLLAQFDQNKDNKLNKAEFTNWAHSSNPWQDVSTKILTDDLTGFDTNQDGFINPEESQNITR